MVSQVVSYLVSRGVTPIGLIKVSISYASSVVNISVVTMRLRRAKSIVVRMALIFYIVRISSNAYDMQA